ncbi:unnamed protein product, partial [Discosporangium mesarthrocarpum]
KEGNTGEGTSLRYHREGCTRLVVCLWSTGAPLRIVVRRWGGVQKFELILLQGRPMAKAGKWSSRYQMSISAPPSKAGVPVTNDVQTAVRELFSRAQEKTKVHKDCSVALHGLLTNGYDKELACDEFLVCVSRLLLVWKKEPAVERLIQFVVLTVTLGTRNGDGKGKDDDKGDREADDEVVEMALCFLLRKVHCLDKAVRYRSCQVVAAILAGMSNLYLSEKLFEEIKLWMLPRLRDKLPAIRAQAGLALSYLQADPEVWEELEWMMMSDTSADARRVVLENIMVDRCTVHKV